MNDSANREHLSNEIAALMGPLVRTLRAAFADTAADLRLTPTEAQTVWLLSLREALTTKQLARALDIDPANASTLVGRLAARGLVRRRPAADDRRKRLVSLTAKGRTTRERLADGVAERRPSFARLTTDELIAFRDLLRRVSEPGP